MTAESVRAAAAKYLEPGQLAMLVVGKWSEIEPGDAGGRHHPLTAGRVLAAVWRVERNDAAGAAQGYALRFLLDPAEKPAASAPRFALPDMAAAC